MGNSSLLHLRRAIVGISTVAMFAGFAIAPAANAALAFHDVPSGSWYSEALDGLCNKNIIDCTRTTFNPGAYLNRAEMAKIAVLAVGVKESDMVDPETPTFSDVPKSAWFYKYVETAYKLGIVAGDSGKTTFRPGDNVNRAEILKILVNALQLDQAAADSETTAFADVSADAWFKPFVKAAYHWSVIDMKANKMFYPGQFATRAEAIKMTAAALKPVARVMTQENSNSQTTTTDNSSSTSVDTSASASTTVATNGYVFPASSSTDSEGWMNYTSAKASDFTGVTADIYMPGENYVKYYKGYSKSILGSASFSWVFNQPTMSEDVAGDRTNVDGSFATMYPEFAPGNLKLPYINIAQIDVSDSSDPEDTKMTPREFAEAYFKAVQDAINNAPAPAGQAKTTCQWSAPNYESKTYGGNDYVLLSYLQVCQAGGSDGAVGKFPIYAFAKTKAGDMLAVYFLQSALEVRVAGTSDVDPKKIPNTQFIEQFLTKIHFK